jgi:hypothetical protein
MKRDDQQRLAQPYPTTPDGRPIPDIAAALGWSIRPWRELLAEVRGDLDTTNFGVGWWRLGVETDAELRRRIVVGDYLISLLEGAEHALIDLELHRLELLDHLDREGEFLRDAIALGPRGGFIVDMPPRVSPIDDLSPALVDAHMNGFLRAGATAFDCLGGVVAIVAAVEVGVLRTDWGKVVQKLDKLVLPPFTAAAQLHLTVRAAIDQTLAAGSAAGWQEWLLAYRNLVVHRGHRLKLSQLTPVPSLLDASGRQLVRATVSPVLPSDPEVTDAEALGMMYRDWPVLQEDARVTVAGITTDLRRVMTDVGAVLLDGWRGRRAAPASVPQPLLRQWPDVRRTRQHFFAGYRPGSQPFSPSSFTMNPNFVRRMHASAMADPHNALWSRP